MSHPAEHLSFITYLFAFKQEFSLKILSFLIILS